MFRQDGQDNIEGCSVTLIIGGSETTFMRFDNGARHRKPNAHSLALGRDECVEYAVAIDNVRTVINDIEQHGAVVKGARSNENLGARPVFSVASMPFTIRLRRTTC